MPAEWIWINGEILKFEDAHVGVEDRGYQFADGVYEVIRLYQSVPFTLTEHLARLQRSASAIEISVPLPLEKLAQEIRKLIVRAGVGDGMVYLQLTRGCAAESCDTC